MGRIQKMRTHVLLIYRDMIPSIRLCGHSQMEALAQTGVIDYLARSKKQLTREILNWADVVLLGRLDDQFDYALTERLHKAEKYLIYILDDDLLNVPSTLGHYPFYHSPEVQRTIRGMIGLSDAILTPSPLLGQKYANGERRVIVTEEPAVMPVLYSEHDAQQPIKIGFAGSIDREGDVDSILQAALCQIKAEYGEKIALEFFGVCPAWAHELGAKAFPYDTSYETYRETLNRLGWDIGLAPMPDTSFHACKHYNKFCEYAAAGIAGIFSKEEPYIRLEKSIGLGVFCKNSPQEWVEAMRSLIDDRKKREKLREKVCKCAQDRLNIKTIAQNLLQDAPDVFEYHAPQKRQSYPLYWLNIQNGIWRTAKFFRANGWRFPEAIVKRVIKQMKRC